MPDERARVWAREFQARKGRPPSFADFQRAQKTGYKVSGEIEVLAKVDPDAPTVDSEIVEE